MKGIASIIETYCVNILFVNMLVSIAYFKYNNINIVAWIIIGNIYFILYWFFHHIINIFGLLKNVRPVGILCVKAASHLVCEPVICAYGLLHVSPSNDIVINELIFITAFCVGVKILIVLYEIYDIINIKI